MKAANLIAELLKSAGIRHVFVVSGGASLHIIHGIEDTEGIEQIPVQHEQAGGYAADCYARITGVGCALATSGPGATNLMTAIATSYYDSVPVLYLTGQVTTFRMKGDLPIRQLGFQETPIVPMCRDITKYAATLLKPESNLRGLIESHFSMAFKLMRQGRPGPSLIDLPDDLQRMEV